MVVNLALLARIVLVVAVVVAVLAFALCWLRPRLARPRFLYWSAQAATAARLAPPALLAGIRPLAPMALPTVVAAVVTALPVAQAQPAAVVAALRVWDRAVRVNLAAHLSARSAVHPRPCATTSDREARQAACLESATVTAAAPIGVAREVVQEIPTEARRARAVRPSLAAALAVLAVAFQRLTSHRRALWAVSRRAIRQAGVLLVSRSTVARAAAAMLPETARRVLLEASAVAVAAAVELSALPALVELAGAAKCACIGTKERR